jgi:hypothetical protein
MLRIRTQRVLLEEIIVLSSCDHVGCVNDTKGPTESETRVLAHSSKYNATARASPQYVVKGTGDTLGVDDYDRKGRGAGAQHLQFLVPGDQGFHRALAAEQEVSKQQREDAACCC